MKLKSSSIKNNESLADPSNTQTFRIKINPPFCAGDELRISEAHFKCSNCQASFSIPRKGKEFDKNNKEMCKLVRTSDYGAVIPGLRKTHRFLSRDEKAKFGNMSQKEFVLEQLKTDLVGSRFVACPRCKNYVLFYFV